MRIKGTVRAMSRTKGYPTKSLYDNNINYKFFIMVETEDGEIFKTMVHDDPEHSREKPARGDIVEYTVHRTKNEDKEGTWFCVPGARRRSGSTSLR